MLILVLLIGAVGYFIEAWMLMLAWGNVRLAWPWLPVMTYDTALSVCLPLTLVGVILIMLNGFTKELLR